MMNDESFQSAETKGNVLRFEITVTLNHQFVIARSLVMRWRCEEKERWSSRERARASIASRPAREERRCGLSTRFFVSSTPAPVSSNPSYHLRRPSCRRRGALRNVGAATVGPAVPLTVSFSLCPPSRRNDYLYVSGVSPGCS